MSKPRKKKRSPKRVLALPDLEQSKAAVLNSLSSESGQRTYDHAITEFVDWYCSEPRLAFNRTVVLRYRIYLEQKQYAPTTINLRLPAVRRVAFESPGGKLADRRGGQATAGRRGAGIASGQEELCDARHAHRMRTTTRRVAGIARRVHPVARGALGHRRPAG